MATLIERIRGLTLQQQLMAGGSIGVLLLLLILMMRMIMKEDMALLYAGLDPAAAGEVLAALDQESVAYDVRGGSIYVVQEERDRLRLSLAQRNLPSPASEGYELLDNLDGFSTTSEMFSVTYWRAKEGELARTLMTIPGITAARVHIGAGERGAFVRRDAKRTASVTVTAPSGLDDGQVRAIRYLTALAIPNLPASDVAIIDTMRGLLTADETATSFSEDRRAKSLERDILTLLEARVGVGNARVNVAMDTVRRREEIEERAVDPNSAVITSRNREETRSTEQDADGPVTIASDLPDGEEIDGKNTSESEAVREDVTFAISTTDRRVELLPGGVERLSVAVLLNEVTGPDGEALPRSEAEIDDMRELVAAAAGLKPERGAVVTIRSMPFEPVAAIEPPAEGGILSTLPTGRLIELGIISISLLLFGLFVVKPVLTPSATSSEALLLASAEGNGTSLVGGGIQDDPVLLLRSRSAERPDAAATLLNDWLDEDHHDKEGITA